MVQEILDIDAFSLDCSCCSMYENCSQTFGECRVYNKVLWQIVDGKIREFRKRIFELIIKRDE